MLFSEFALVNHSTLYSDSICIFKEELRHKMVLTCLVIQNQTLKEKQDRKIVGKRENECIGFVVNVPSHTQIEKYFFPALGQEKRMGKQWKSNLHLQEKWLAWLLRGLGFHCSSARSFISSPADNVPALLLSLWAAFWRWFVLNAGPWCQAATREWALLWTLAKSLWLHWTAAEKHLAVGVPAQFFSAYSPDTKYLQHRYPSTWYWRNIPYFSVFSFEEEEQLHKKGWKAITRWGVQRNSDVLTLHTADQ